MRTTDRLLTIDEAAKLLRLAPSTLYRRVADGQLPALKLAGTGRLLFREREVLDQLQPVGHEDEGDTP